MIGLTPACVHARFSMRMTTTNSYGGDLAGLNLLVTEIRNTAAPFQQDAPAPPQSQPQPRTLSLSSQRRQPLQLKWCPPLLVHRSGKRTVYVQDVVSRLLVMSQLESETLCDCFPFQRQHEKKDSLCTFVASLFLMWTHIPATTLCLYSMPGAGTSFSIITLRCRAQVASRDIHSRLRARFLMQPRQGLHCDRELVFL
jgi:hypothetical protein